VDKSFLKLSKIVFTILSICVLDISFANNDVDSILSIKLYEDILKEIEKEENFDKSILLCDKIFTLSEIHFNKKLKAKSEIARLDIYKKFNKYSESLSLVLQLEEKVKEYPTYLECTDRIKIERYLYEYMNTINRYEQAIHHLNHIKELECYYPDMFNILNYEIAVSYFLMKDNKNAKKTVEQYTRENLLNKDSAKLIGAFNQQGLILTLLEENDEAIKHFEKALLLINKTKLRKRLKPTIYGNIGNIYKKKNQNKLAIEYFIKDSKGSLQIGELSSYINSELSLADIYYQEKKYDKVLLILNKLSSHYSKNLSKVSKLTNYKLQSDVYHLINDKKKAYYYLKKYSLLKDTIIKERNHKFDILLKEYNNSLYTKTVQELKSKTLNAKKDLLLLKKESRLKNQKNQLLIFSLLISIGLITLWFKKKYNEKKKNAIIIEKELLISNQNLTLKTKEQELLELKSKSDNKKINTLALELNVKKDFSDKLIKKIEKIDGIKKVDLINIEHFIHNELDLKSSRAKLHNDINELGQTFFDSLLKDHPNLTDSDLKLCSLIILKLPNKEIAISKNIETNSVKIAKNRLKKKLNISNNSTLLSYLESHM